ncbi:MULTISPECIES: AEC family transporter [unclassified Methylobacterium]|jgi:malate permease and related proteins|uniref:AEC family transporter n=1 Tax=unclassified Methylobacterium TaxID=2615210 RepID=UPI001355E44D|nr:hypothetical protein [Methylobacterium sp. 2A]MWV22868.1 hypothetical protein [Methylobacterium sp. 2A]
MIAVAGLWADIAARMLPAYAAIGVGYAVGRLSRQDWLKVLSGVLMYGLIPIVVFRNALALAFGAAIGHVVLSITFSALMVLCGLLIVPRIRTDVPRRLATCAFGYTNIGWFGVPTGLALFGPDSLPILVMAYVGGLFFGNTVGFYLVARDRFSVAASLRKMAAIPPLYAFGAGLAARAFGLGDAAILSADAAFRIAALLMSGCGMMVVGLGASRLTLSWTAIRAVLRLIIWRHVAGIGVIWAVIGLFSACGAPIPPEIRAVVVLIGLLPVAGNIVIFAAQLQGDVAASALIVAVSTTVSTVGILIWSVMLLGL